MDTDDGSEGTTHHPIPLEELLEKRRREREELSRPRFMSRAEREQLIKEKEIEFSKKSGASPRINTPKPLPATDHSKSNESNVPAISEEERASLKEKFLGIRDENKVKKPRRFLDKKFHFDWDASEDTSAAALSLTFSRNQGARDEFSASKKTKIDERHWSERSLTEMTDRDWRIFKEDYNINTSGGVVPHPIRFWSESGLPSELVSTINRLGYESPTPIQRQAIPLALSRRDFIGIAETGSGKTASFILPMITEIMKLPRMNAEVAADGPYGLVVVPTRELANQIEIEAKKFLNPLGLRCFAIVGGHSIAEQSFQLRNGAEIIIATPGRLKDCLDQHIIVLNQCKYVVLDEADRMIDMNFEEDLNYILETIPRDTGVQQTSKYPMHITMFSATMPVSVEKLAKAYLMKPAIVTIGQSGFVAENIQQRVELLRQEDKPARLSDILLSQKERFNPPIIIFVNQKRTVDYLCKRLEAYNLRVVSLHGGKGQDQREAAISLLRTGNKDILVATDVAGRGIDVKNVSLVVNYDMPKSIEDYIHRVGRTGRAGNSGTSITFLTSDDSDLFYDLRAVLQKSPNNVIPSEFLNHELTRSRQHAPEKNIEL